MAAKSSQPIEARIDEDARIDAALGRIRSSLEGLSWLLAERPDLAPAMKAEWQAILVERRRSRFNVVEGGPAGA